MITLQEQDRLMLQAIRWTTAACDAIQRAGGSVHLLDKLPDDLKTTFIRNGIELNHIRYL